MLIDQISGRDGDGDPVLRTLALRAFTETFPLAGIAEFYSFAGDTDKKRSDNTQFTPGQTRTTSTGYTANERSPNFKTLDLKIYGDTVHTDIAYGRRGYDVGSQRAIDLREFSEGLGRYVMDAVINHDGSGNQIKGFAQQCADLSRNVIFDGANGGALPTGNASADRKQQDKLLEFLFAQMADIMGGPQALVVNGQMWARLQSIGRSYITTSRSQDVFDRSQEIVSFAGVPLINAGYKNDDVGQVIGNVEVAGANSDCTSIYMVRFGEGTNTTIGTNSGLDVKDNGVVSTKYETLVELDIDLAVLKTKSIKRLSGFRLSA